MDSHLDLLNETRIRNLDIFISPFSEVYVILVFESLKEIFGGFGNGDTSYNL